MLAALASWLDARAQGGQWLLRIEDVDSERCKPEHAATIRAQLQALGLAWDAELPAQSQRLNRYAEQLESWLSSDRVYACRCNRRALAPYRGAGETCYPGLCRGLGLPSTGHALRFALPRPARRDFVDRLLGPQSQDVATQCGDFVLRRRTGDYSYQYAVCMDDAEQGITDVVRGQDLLPSTGRQLLLLEALGAPPPRYLHHPLIHDADGRKLSKATGADAAELTDPLASLRQAAQALGLPPQVGAQHSVAALLEAGVRAWPDWLQAASRKG